MKDVEEVKDGILWVKGYTLLLHSKHFANSAHSFDFFWQFTYLGS